MNRGRLSDDSGITMVFLAVILLVLLSMAALAIDLGQLYVAKQRAQNVADAAALAGGLLLDGTPACKDGAADAADHCATSNNETTTGAHWTVHKPSGDYDYGTTIGIRFPTEFQKDDGTPESFEQEGSAIEASAAVPVTFGFARVLGFSGSTVAAKAIVALEPISDFQFDLPPWCVEPDALKSGELVELKSAEWKDRDPTDLGSGSYGAVSFMQDEDKYVGGGDAYKDRIADTDPDLQPVDITDPMTVKLKTGNMPTPTGEALEDRFGFYDGDPTNNDTWTYEAWLQAYEDTGEYPATKRLVILPVITPGDYSGSQVVNVEGFAAFFIDVQIPATEGDRKPTGPDKDWFDGILYGHFLEAVVIGDVVHWNPFGSWEPGTGNTVTTPKLVS